jgi:RimJ/RimL family protein N-acetyltransferase
MEPITLHSERLILRPLRAADREALAALCADAKVMEFFPARLTRAESDQMAEHIERHFADHGFGPWVVEEKTGEPFVGFVGLYRTSFQAHFAPCVEILWRLMPSHWGKGYATEGARAALRFAFEELALPEVVSMAVVANHNSRQVMERIGMRHDAPGDFEHPNLPEGHPLRRHALYRLRKEAWEQRSRAAPGPRVC